MMILDKFFLKYEWGIKLIPQKNLPSKKSSLIRVKHEIKKKIQDDC